MFYKTTRSEIAFCQVNGEKIYFKDIKLKRFYNKRKKFKNEIFDIYYAFFKMFIYMLIMLLFLFFLSLQVDYFQF